MASHGVLILECLDESDPGSEGHFISHMLSLMEVPHQYIEVRTKRQLIQLLQSSPYRIVHITTHGTTKSLRQNEKFQGLWTQEGTLKKADLKQLQGHMKGYTVVSTACLSASSHFRKGFVEVTGCSHYIAPKGSPYFYDAVFFAHIFYHKHLILKRSVRRSFNEYRKRYKNPHRFVLWPPTARSKATRSKRRRPGC
jgi:hypothetical protein